MSFTKIDSFVIFSPMQVLNLLTIPPMLALVRFDTLAATMALLVLFLGVVVLRFSARYLEGDPHRTRFLVWMGLTLASVITLVISNHMLLLVGAWTATSLCLHRLLLHHPERPPAVFAARKKFVYSRVAELSLLIAAAILYDAHGTWYIHELEASIALGNHAGLPLAAFLIVFTAMLKSAQFPFHSWLPDTMDTPTPVSALMHAGIINAGGFLIIRLAPIFTAAPSALYLLAVIGTVTAVFGAIVMLAQPGVKKALAFSTIAQMGFMMIQIGLGAWGLALLHLVAHSMYKAYAFLQAGSTIGAVPRAAIPLATNSLALGTGLAAVMVATLAAAFYAIVQSESTTPFVFLLILVFAIAYGIARAASGHRGSLLRALGAAAAITTVGLVLHLLSAYILPMPVMPDVPVLLVIFIVLAFIGLFVFQSLLWRASRHHLGQQLYVHALNGFYISPLANRLLNRLWPDKSA